MYLTVGMIPVLIGVVGVRLAPGLADGEQLLPTLGLRLLPTVLYALFAGGLISAILSTVDSTLLTASGLLSHNLLVPVFRIEHERTKVLVARAGVVTFGVVAYVLAHRAEGVFALVEQASAFGSAGVVVTVCFGLFTRLGGRHTALATLLAGTISYLAFNYSGNATPFLISVGVSLATYVAGALLERGTQTARHA
jgi:solute:Na+ symporter, SSS family